MTDRKIQQIWQNSYEAFLSSGYFLSDAQKKASYAILNCKTGSFGMNISLCPDCGHMEFRNNSETSVRIFPQMLCRNASGTYR